ncbi:hypothetical protein B0H11DRAFT_2104970 [Mycena galericulata]|nr:hypothetical protein B0H11DRAFT_2104970 [Mycena galericulata]
MPHSIALAELPTAENAESPAYDFFLSYPYLLVWTDQVDVWRFSDSSDLTHISMLEFYVTKRSSPTPIIDHVHRLLILPEPWRVGSPQVSIFTLCDGELAREIELLAYAEYLLDVDIQYRQADGHALMLLRSIIEVDVTGPAVSFLNLVNLPPHSDEREKRWGDLPACILKPISFGMNGDTIVTSTTQWLSKVDLLYWQAGPSKDDRQPTKTLELLPGLEGCKAMLPLYHLAINDSTLVLCTHEDECVAITKRTSVRGLDTSSLTVRWTAKPIPGKVKTLHHIRSLNLLVLSAAHDVMNHDEVHESLQIRTAIVILDARTGDQRAIHAVNSDAQGSFVVDCFVSPDSDNPIVGLAWQNGNILFFFFFLVPCSLILTVGLNNFITDGFEREGESERVQTLALFPAELIAASLGHREIVAVAGVKKHPVISEGGREEDIPDWEEEEGKVMFAKW